MVGKTDFALAALDGERVVASNRDGNVRVSPHCYNSSEDIDTVLAAPGTARSLLR